MFFKDFFHGIKCGDLLYNNIIQNCQAEFELIIEITNLPKFKYIQRPMYYV